MKIFITLFIFCLVLFLYIHIQYHFKTSNDLEIYELEQPSKEKLEEICDLRQPVIFDFIESDRIVKTSNKNYILNHYHAFETKIRNSKETDYNNEIYIPVPLHTADKLFRDDNTASYFSENNSDFLQETGVIKNMQYNDAFLRPYFVSNCNYDIMMGSNNTMTPLRYEINYRNYFLVTQGSVQIKLIPPNSSKYLYTKYDYEILEFSSPVHVWNVQPQYTADYDKIKSLDITLHTGSCIYIPAYWWYSIKFSRESSISCFRYRTYMNNIAISPHIALYALQIQNIKRDVVKKVDLSSSSKKIGKKKYTNDGEIYYIQEDDTPMNFENSENPDNSANLENSENNIQLNESNESNQNTDNEILPSNALEQGETLYPNDTTTMT